jgi:hypothetical protein
MGFAPLAERRPPHPTSYIHRNPVKPRMVDIAFHVHQRGQVEHRWWIGEA